MIWLKIVLATFIISAAFLFLWALLAIGPMTDRQDEQRRDHPSRWQ